MEYAADILLFLWRDGSQTVTAQVVRATPEVMNERISQRGNMVGLHFVERAFHAVCHRRHLVRLVIATRLPTATHGIHCRHHLILLSSASCRQPMQTLIRQCTFIIEAQQIVLRHCFILWFLIHCFRSFLIAPSPPKAKTVIRLILSFLVALTKYYYTVSLLLYYKHFSIL